MSPELGQILAISARTVLLVAYSALALTGCTRRHDEVASEPASPSKRDAATPADFNGDKISEWFIYRDGAWLYFGPSTGAEALPSVKTGAPGSGCTPVPADYDGDGKVDLSQKCGGDWHFYDADGTHRKSIPIGAQPGDFPVPADYDGDGDADLVVFRARAWMFYDSGSGANTKSVRTGSGGGGVPVPMDYDGDGRTDFSVYENGAWIFYKDDGTPYKGVWTGNVAGDVPVPGDYHGLGREEVVIFRGGAWQFYNLDTATATGGVWTGAAPSPGRPLQPAPLDLDGDGTLEFSIYTGKGWNFYKDDGTLLRGVRIDGVPNDQPISRRQLP